jgi:23S rRNA pseudouridine2605 synthase
MHHGRKREIRLLFQRLGHEVKRLRRYQIGALQLKGIPLRAGKVLSTKDISALFLNPRTPRARHEVCALTSGAETASADKLNED